MADAMRAKGWEVTELPRETVITIHQLTGFDLVIRPPAFFPYSEAEASWENVRGARQYQIVVLGASAQHWGDWSVSRTFDVLPMKRGMTSNE